MADLEIGYIAGSSTTLDRRLDSVRAVVQQVVRPHQLVSVSSNFVQSDLPVILDVSVASPAVTHAVESIRSGHVIRPWLILRMSDWFGVQPHLLEGFNVHVYRNAINVRPAVLKFLERYPIEIRVPITHYALSAQKLIGEQP